MLFKEYYPEEVSNLEDYALNEVSRKRLDNLIQKSPGVGYWSDDYIYVYEGEYALQKVRLSFDSFIENVKSHTGESL